MGSRELSASALEVRTSEVTTFRDGRLPPASRIQVIAVGLLAASSLAALIAEVMRQPDRTPREEGSHE